jgi:carboxyl-terminal processing protease
MVCVAISTPLSAQTAEPLAVARTAEDYRADALALVPLLQENYAYLDDLPGGMIPSSPLLNAERDAVHDQASLLHYAEDILTTLADHHALTARSFDDDWALVPSFSDIWLVRYTAPIGSMRSSRVVRLRRPACNGAIGW